MRDIRRNRNNVSLDKKHLPSALRHLPSHFICNLLQLSATSCLEVVRVSERRLELVRSFPKGLENAEACNAVSRQDFRSKSYIALKEARESLYWIDLLHRNSYLDDKQFNSIYTDCEELVKILVARCKKLDAELNAGK